MTAASLPLASTARHAETLVHYLVDNGPTTRAKTCADLGWPEGRFGSALRHARDHLCPTLDVTIPAPTPETGWVYQVTDEWRPVGDGAAWTLGLVETRLRAIQRDVLTVLPQLTHGTADWRAANLLAKHLPHLTHSLEDIHGARQARRRSRQAAS